MQKSKDITNIIADPVLINFKNLDGTLPFFFHGLTYDAFKITKDKGLESTHATPTLSLSFNFSLRYARKCESDLQKLIVQGKQKDLKKEVEFLLKNNVFTKEEFKNDTKNYWIAQADEFYERTIDVTRTGTIIVLYSEQNQVEPALSGNIWVNDIEKILYVTTSVWNSRQFAFQAKSQNLENMTYGILDLNHNLVQATRKIRTFLKTGRLTPEALNTLSTTIHNNIKLKEVTNNFPIQLLDQSLTSQVIESTLIEQLRNLYIAKKKLEGYKILFDKEGEKVEDTRWYISADEYLYRLKMLQQNILPNKYWNDYLIQNSKELTSL